MIPFLHVFGMTLPTFGLMLWLAAVLAALLLHMNLKRHGVASLPVEGNRLAPHADALTIVAAATLAGVMGAKAWHELEHPADLWSTLQIFGHLLRVHKFSLFFAEFLDWAKAGFAWFGGMAGGILMLLWQARLSRLKPLTMLDLCAPSAAIGYGIGRIGCHLSGDGDYGIPTRLPWGVSYSKGLVPTFPGIRVHPTPIYECIFGLLLAWYLWRRGSKPQPRGRVVGEYLVLAGLGRFLVEFIRINPRVLWGLTNAQLGSLAAMLAGVIILLVSRTKRVDTFATAPLPATEVAA